MTSKLVKLHDPNGREIWVKADSVTFVRFPLHHAKNANASIGIGPGLAVRETPKQVKEQLAKAGVTIIDD